MLALVNIYSVLARHICCPERVTSVNLFNPYNILATFYEEVIEVQGC